MIDSLQQIGLDLKTTGDAQTTIEEVQSLLHSLEQHETASKLLDLGKLFNGIIATKEELFINYNYH